MSIKFIPPHLRFSTTNYFRMAKWWFLVIMQEQTSYEKQAIN